MGVEWRWEIYMKGNADSMAIALDKAVKHGLLGKSAEGFTYEHADEQNKTSISFVFKGKQQRADMMDLIDPVVEGLDIEAKVEGYIEDRNPDASFTIKDKENQ